MSTLSFWRCSRPDTRARTSFSSSRTISAVRHLNRSFASAASCVSTHLRPSPEALHETQSQTASDAARAINQTKQQNAHEHSQCRCDPPRTECSLPQRQVPSPPSGRTRRNLSTTQDIHNTSACEPPPLHHLAVTDTIWTSRLHDGLRCEGKMIHSQRPPLRAV